MSARFGQYETGVNLAEPYLGEGAEVYRIMFPNGMGASIVRHSSSYGGRGGQWELIPIRKIDESKHGWDFCDLPDCDPAPYGWLDEEAVARWLRRIEALPVGRWRR